MKRLIGPAIATVAFASMLVLFAAPKRVLPKVHAENDGDACTADTLNGPYGFVITGTILGGPLAGPLAIVGVTTFDGVRNISADQTANANGNVLVEHETGTYTVNSNCTGSSTVGGHTANFVILSGGKEQQLVGTDRGAVITGSFKKMSPAAASPR